MKLFNAVRKYGSRLAVAGAAAVGSAAAMADATSATTALTSVTGDVQTIGWAAFGVIVVAVGFKYMRRAL